MRNIKYFLLITFFTLTFLFSFHSIKIITNNGHPYYTQYSGYSIFVDHPVWTVILTIIVLLTIILYKRHSKYRILPLIAVGFIYFPVPLNFLLPGTFNYSYLQDAFKHLSFAYYANLFLGTLLIVFLIVGYFREKEVVTT